MIRCLTPSFSRLILRRCGGSFAVVFAAVGISLFFAPRSASASEGSIIEGAGYAWSENTGWLDFGTEDGSVRVDDDGMLGYAWSENLGWVSLSCRNDASCDTTDYGVSNDGEGNLSGYAWSENTGWIDFKPAQGGVVIDDVGRFSGYAWSENTGWIVFGCATTGSCDTGSYDMMTDWRPPDSGRSENRTLDISDVRFSSGRDSITVEWVSDRVADSYIRYGTDKALGRQQTEKRREKKHRMVLRGLVSGTRYYFRVKSTDADGNYDRSRTYAVFTRSGFDNLFVGPGSARTSEDAYGEDDYETVDIRVSDPDWRDGERAENDDVKPDTSPIVRQSPEDSRGNLLVRTRDFFGMVFSRAWSGIGSLASGFSDRTYAVYDSVREAVLDTQRTVDMRMAALRTDMTGIWNGVRGRMASEKASVASGSLSMVDYFTTQIFKRDGVKYVAQVKFQLLDPRGVPLERHETTLFSDPQTTTTDENGVATFGNVPVGVHTLAFLWQGEAVRKQVVINDTLTEEGMVRAEIIRIQTGKDAIAVWMWCVIALAVVSVALASYFAVRYYRLKRASSL